MMSKKVLLGIFSLLALVLFGGIIYFVYNMYTTDAIKFKREYESLNNKKIENTNYKHRELHIPRDNPFVYKTADDIVKLMNKYKVLDFVVSETELFYSKIIEDYQKSTFEKTWISNFIIFMQDAKTKAYQKLGLT